MLFRPRYKRFNAYLFWLGLIFDGACNACISITKQCHFMTIIEENNAKSIVYKLVKNLIWLFQIEKLFMV